MGELNRRSRTKTPNSAPIMMKNASQLDTLGLLGSSLMRSFDPDKRGFRWTQLDVTLRFGAEQSCSHTLRRAPKRRPTPTKTGASPRFLKQIEQHDLLAAQTPPIPSQLHDA